MESKETRKLLFFQTQWFNEFFFILLIEKREGLAVERLKFASSTTGPSATEGAVKLKSASSLTTGDEGERSGQNHWTDMPQGTRNESCKILHSAEGFEIKGRNEKRSADVSGNARHFCDEELNYQDVRKGVNRR